MQHHSHQHSLIHRYFQDYQAYHQTRGNEFTHRVGIPLILIGIFGILSRISLPAGWIQSMGGFSWSVAEGVLILGVLFYLRLSMRLGALFSLVLLVLDGLGRYLPIELNLVFFCLGWIFQGVGHAYYEKNRPAFFKNFTHLMIGPLWIFSKMIRFEAWRSSTHASF